MKNARFLTTWGVALLSTLAAASAIHQQTLNPLDSAQQTVITSSTRVVVVVIPGFPIESILIGALLGVAIIFVARRREINQKRES